VVGGLSGVLGFLFTGDAAASALIQPALLVLAVAQPLCSIVFVLDGVLIGAGDGRYLALAGLINLVIYAPALVLVAMIGSGAAGLAWLSVAFFGVYMLARLGTLGVRVRGAAWTAIPV
jgi:Na+-driven multidrug efflux pump